MVHLLQTRLRHLRINIFTPRQSGNRSRFHPAIFWLIHIGHIHPRTYPKGRTNIINRNELGIKINIKIKHNKNKISYLTIFSIFSQCRRRRQRRRGCPLCSFVLVWISVIAGPPRQPPSPVALSKLRFRTIGGSAWWGDRLTAFYGIGSHIQNAGKSSYTKKRSTLQLACLWNEWHQWISRWLCTH